MLHRSAQRLPASYTSNPTPLGPSVTEEVTPTLDLIKAAGMPFCWPGYQHIHRWDFSIMLVDLPLGPGSDCLPVAGPDGASSLYNRPARLFLVAFFIADDLCGAALVSF